MAVKNRRRTAGMLMGAALAAVSLTACGTSSSNAVATVGDSTITVQEYESALNAAYSDPIVGEAAKGLGSSYAVSLLNDMVSAEIASEVAADAGVSASAADVDAKLTELLGGQSLEDAQAAYLAQGTPVTEDQMRLRLQVLLVTEELGQQATGQTQEAIAAASLTDLKAQRDANPITFTTYTLTLAVTSDQARAQSWVDAANSGTAGSLVDVVAANPDPDPTFGGATPDQPVDGGQEDPATMAQVDVIPTGQTGLLTLGPDPSSGAFFYYAVTVQDKTLADDAALEQQANQTAEQQFQQAGLTAAAQSSQSIEIEINPRYGTLDRPEQGLPSVSAPSSDNFSEPMTSAPAVPGMPGMPVG